MRSARVMPRRRPPLRLRWAASVVAACAAIGATPAAAVERIVTVLLDRAQVMSFPPDTTTVIVGNPIIADIAMLRNTGQVIVTGKGFGDTNLVFLDSRGAVLSEARLRVREPDAMMVVQRGMDRETYACHPRCQPTVTLGDSSTFLQRSINDIQTRNAQATGAAASSATAAQSH